MQVSHEREYLRLLGAADVFSVLSVYGQTFLPIISV